MCRIDTPAMFGFWNVNKPAGVTSRWVVNAAERACRGAKIGHAGTLDPLAEGVLVIAVGPATRLIPYVQRETKCYRATFQFGRSSASDDLETELLPVPLPRDLTADRIQQVLPRFTGIVDQRPPDYSAVKYAGKRAYRLARRGQPMLLAAKRVTIQSLTLREWRSPFLELDITCGSGTYVRSIGRDLAAALGTAAVMTQLTRLRVGDFRLEDAITIEQLQSDPAGHWIEPAQALGNMRRLPVSTETARDLAAGRPVPWPEAAPATSLELAAMDASGQLIAIVRADPDGRCWPVRNFRQN